MMSAYWDVASCVQLCPSVDREFTGIVVYIKFWIFDRLTGQPYDLHRMSFTYARQKVLGYATEQDLLQAIAQDIAVYMRDKSVALNEYGARHCRAALCARQANWGAAYAREQLPGYLYETPDGRSMGYDG